MLKESLKQYYNDPYGYVDRLEVNVKGTDVNILKNDSGLRKTIAIYTVLCTAVWILLGFDSGVGMFEYPVTHFLGNLVEYFKGDITVQTLFDWGSYVELSKWAYGKTMHWSAFTIYGALYVGISRLLTRLDVSGSRNTMYSAAFTLFNIGVFEWFWMAGFAVYQGQWWVVTWQWPQVRILVQNVAFTVVGLLAVVQFYVESHVLDGDSAGERVYRYKLGVRFIAAVLLTLLSIGFWVNYGDYLPVSRVSVPIRLSDGFNVTWVNGDRFPQTLYTVRTDFTDGINAGSWYYVEDDLVHFVNTGVKVLMALCSYLWVGGWRSG